MTTASGLLPRPVTDRFNRWRPLLPVAVGLSEGADRTEQRAHLEPEEGRELGELLHSLGVGERPARIIGFLAVHGDGRSAEIEGGLEMRQPEVSQATKALRERGWVAATSEKTPGKGRPVNVYRLAVDLEDIVNEVEARRREAINEELARIDQLRNLVDRRKRRAEAEPEADVTAEKQVS